MAVLAVAAIAALPAPAYYHFIHYLASGNAPEKFDINSLPEKTVTFFVSQDGPAVLARNDSFGSVLGQIRQAAAVWNGVSSSALRVGFGGLENGAIPQNTPAGDVLFEDLPPGVYGYGGPTSSTTPVTLENGSQFVPITRSAIHLNRNLTVLPGPSYRESFFLTAVHEMGHALGLQHTFTSSAMSQATTRSTTLTRPLDVDDVAGISVLYPNAAFAQNGSISGRVTTGGRGAHLTSVVAIRAGMGAVSALTNADGTFRIDGVPPGQYYVYAHALPPDADIRGPWNADGSQAAAASITETLFYPGTRDPQQAAVVPVTAGKTATGIDFSLGARTSLPVYDAQVYGYLNNYTVVTQPAYVNLTGSNWTVTAAGTGLGANGQAPGLNAQVLGGGAFVRSGGVRPFAANGYTYIALDLGFNQGAGPGPAHLVFTTPSFVHVLPSAVLVTRGDPPVVSSAALNGDGTVTVTGSKWAADSQIYFDGLPAALVSLDAKGGSAVVTPPAGASQQVSAITVFNSDGQSSQLVQAAAPVTFAYAAASAPVVTGVSPAALPAGAEASVEITTANMALADGVTTVGFGTSDVLVQRVFVTGPNRLRVNVSVRPGAAFTLSGITVISAFQFATAAGAFQIQPAVAGLPAPFPVLENALPGLNGIYAGAVVSLYGLNLAAAGLTPSVTFNGQAATILYAAPGQINLQIPASLNTGLAIMALNNGVLDAYPVNVIIDSQPAVVTAVQNSDGAAIDAAHPAHRGDFISVSLANVSGTPAKVQVSVGGAMHTVVDPQLTGGTLQASFRLNSDEPTGDSQPLIVYLDGRSSFPVNIPVQP